MYEIKSITIEDENSIKKLSAAASAIVKEYYDPIIGPQQNDYMIAMFQSEDGIKNQLRDGHNYYVIEENGEYIGFFSYYFKEHKLYLNKLYLNKSFRGRGIGRAALEFIIEQGKKAGYSAMFLNVNKYNDSSIAAYKSMGFELLREEKNPIGNGYYMDDYVLIKQFS